MKVSEVRIRLVINKRNLCAYCSVVFDNVFVVHDVRIIDGERGLFVVMPSRKLTESCPSCWFKNPRLSQYCSRCGIKLPEPKAVSGICIKCGAERGLAASSCECGGQIEKQPLRLYTDVCHPISPEFRGELDNLILDAYDKEMEKQNNQEKAEDEEDHVSARHGE